MNSRTEMSTGSEYSLTSGRAAQGFPVCMLQLVGLQYLWTALIFGAGTRLWKRSVHRELECCMELLHLGIGALLTHGIIIISSHAVIV